MDRETLIKLVDAQHQTILILLRQLVDCGALDGVALSKALRVASFDEGSSGEVDINPFLAVYSVTAAIHAELKHPEHDRPTPTVNHVSSPPTTNPPRPPSSGK